MNSFLKETRIRKGYTQKQIAELLEISIKTYQNYESGKTFPRVPVLKKLAIILEVSSDELISL